MNLKKDLEQRLRAQATHMAKSVRHMRKSIPLLRKIDLKTATYKIRIVSQREAISGNDNHTFEIFVEEKGLIDAIRKAEEKFNEESSHSQLGGYGVSIKVGDFYYKVPDKYWEKLIKEY
ncbi:MAG TPA: hypothetical protein VKE88_00215 [Candidatus Nanoarchaeia archaeon]|nr:hypothetical protein [Candidatus Nanoarchaeia archaeon]